MIPNDRIDGCVWEMEFHQLHCLSDVALIFLGRVIPDSVVNVVSS